MHSHYVPKMYLKGWQTIHNNRNKQICIYSKEKSPEFKALKEVAWREDYYTDEAEKQLDRDLENKTTPVLTKVRQEYSLTEAERLSLSAFMFVQWFRVPFNIEGLFQQIRAITLPATIKEMELLKEVMKEEFKDLNLPEEVFDWSKLESKLHEKEVYSELLLRDKFGYKRKIQRMNWRFLKAAPGKKFVTSDNPFFFDRRIGLNDPMFSYFIFPISENLLLTGRLSNIPGKDFEPISAEKTDELNLSVIKNCDVEVFASIDDPSIAEMVDKYAGQAKSIKHKINIKFE